MRGSQINYTVAKAFADAHEFGSSSQVLGGIGQQMDLHNNAAGRNIAANLGNSEKCYLRVRSVVHREMFNGRLKIVKRYSFNEKVSEEVGNTRFLVPSNDWSSNWPSDYINRVNQVNDFFLCYIGSAG